VNPREVCAAVMPCWNEAATVDELVRRTQRHVATVWVVDDGSTDTTAARATAAGARVLRQPARRGKGAALRAGLEAARADGFAWAITLDGDGQHPPEWIPAFIERARQTGAGLVVGNRLARAPAMPPVRRWVNRWMSRRLSGLAGREWPDTQCGFRLLRLALWERLDLSAEHFEIESDLLLAVAAAGARIEFVPVPVVPAPRPSRIHPVADSWRWLRWWWRARHRFKPHDAPLPEPVLR
jgi:glycosyltransferase involved in cell wall biosynthesis